MSFICMRMKNHFHINGWALSLVLIQRPGGTRKWPICKAADHVTENDLWGNREKTNRRRRKSWILIKEKQKNPVLLPVFDSHTFHILYSPWWLPKSTRCPLKSEGLEHTLMYPDPITAKWHFKSYGSWNQYPTFYVQHNVKQYYNEVLLSSCYLNGNTQINW